MTDRINRAFLFALYAHGEQRRKDGLPYIVHPFEVGMILARNGADEALVCAGKVLGTVPSERKVVVEGINVVTCHIKPRKQGEEGGIVKREAAIYASKVQVVCPKCDKPTRVAYEIKDGKKVRVCKHCGAAL